MAQYAVALLLAIAFPPPSLAQEEPVSRSITVVSEPAADICELAADFRLTCFARSPAAVQLQFRSASSFRRLHLVRVGYETQKVAVSPNDSTVKAVLKRRAILVEATDRAPEVAEVRGIVNTRLSEIFFQGQPPAGLKGFEFLGPVNIARTPAGRFEIVVPIMVEDEFRVRYLVPIDRNAQPPERPLRIVRALWDSYVEPLAAALHRALATHKAIESITIAASYSRTRYVLVDDDATFRFTSRTWVGSTTNRFGDVVQKVDHFSTTTTNVPIGYQKLAETKKAYVALFAVAAASAPAWGEAVRVFSNDNRRGELVSVDRR